MIFKHCCKILVFLVILSFLSCVGSDSDDDDAADDDTQVVDDDDADDDADDDVDDDANDDIDDDVDDDVDDDANDDIDDDVDDDIILPHPPGRYVAFVTDATENAIEALMNFRTQQGYSVEIVNVDDLMAQTPGAPVEELARDYLIDTYETLREVSKPYCLIVAGYNTMPMPVLDTDPMNPNSYRAATDAYYADIDVDWDFDGDGVIGEWDEDVFSLDSEYLVGRIPSDDPVLVSDYCDKVVDFESDGESAYKWDTLLLAGYIAIDGDSAIILNMIRNNTLTPGGYDVYRMYEEGGPLPGEEILNKDNLLEQWGNNPYGLVIWASHGGTHGTFFIDSDDAPLFGAGETSMAWASACSQSDPGADDNIGASMVLHGPGAAFIGSSETTHPGNLGEGSLIFMVMTDYYMNRSDTLGHALYHSMDVYIENFWMLPYDRGLFLRNYYGFHILGDPAQTYWPREEG
jgi:Peptidase family C25